MTLTELNLTITDSNITLIEPKLILTDISVTLNEPNLILTENNMTLTEYNLTGKVKNEVRKTGLYFGIETEPNRNQC